MYVVSNTEVVRVVAIFPSPSLVTTTLLGDLFQ
jgi:hypothetical protein